MAAIDDTVDVEALMADEDELTPHEVGETRWVINGIRPVKPIFQAIHVLWKFMHWLGKELPWIAMASIGIAALFRGEIALFLSNL